MPNDRRTATLAGTALFTALVPGVVAGVVPALLRGGASIAPAGAPTWRAALGGLAFGAGVTVYLWCAWDFATAGRGTPSPTHPPRALVLRGLYHHSRNPMYVGVLLAVVGQGVWGGSAAVLLYAAALAIVFHLRIVIDEEPALRGTFGDAYDAYSARVPRWLGRVRAHGATPAAAPARAPAVAPTIVPTPAGFTLRDGDGHIVVIEWAQVRRAAAYKRDLYTTDAIMLLLECDPPAPPLLELSEESPGFAELFGPMERALGVSPAWYVEIMTPAFEATPRILYDRSALDPR